MKIRVRHWAFTLSQKFWIFRYKCSVYQLEPSVNQCHFIKKQQPLSINRETQCDVAVRREVFSLWSAQSEFMQICVLLQHSIRLNHLFLTNSSSIHRLLDQRTVTKYFHTSPQAESNVFVASPEGEKRKFNWFSLSVVSRSEKNEKLCRKIFTSGRQVAPIPDSGERLNGILVSTRKIQSF